MGLPWTRVKATGSAQYDVFISYKRDSDQSVGDSKLAEAVERGLTRLKGPLFRTRTLNVFRDTSDLAAYPNLWQSVANALDASKYLLLVASPEARDSDWINREVQHWKVHKPPGYVLIAWAAGDLKWNRAGGGFDPCRTTCLPPAAFQGLFTSEPNAVDFRWVRGMPRWRLRLGNRQFLNKIAEIAAPLHGKSKKELYDSERHRQRRMRFAAVLTVSLLLSSVTFGIYQTHRADAEQTVAVSQRLAVLSMGLRDSDPVAAELLSVAAWRIAPTPEARASLRAAATMRGRGVIITSLDHIESVAFSQDNRTLITGGYDRTVRFWDVTAQRALGEPLADTTGRPYAVAVSPDGRTLATSDSDRTIRLWDMTTRQPINGPVDGSTGRTVGSVLEGHTAPVVSLDFSPDGRVLVSGSRDGTARLWDVSTYRPVGKVVTGYSAGSNAIAYSPDGRTVAVARVDNTVLLWDAVVHQPVGTIPAGDYGVPRAIAFSPDGTALATSGDGNENPGVRVWDVSTRQLRSQIRTAHSDVITVLAYNSEGSVLATGSRGIFGRFE